MSKHTLTITAITFLLLASLAAAGLPSTPAALADEPPQGREAAQEEPQAAYLAAIQNAAAMVNDAQAQGLAAEYGLNIVNVTWEDTGRYQNSSVGPNISDVTIQVQHQNRETGDYDLTLMPVIRYPNFEDLSADLSPDRFYLLVGNETGEPLERVSLTDYLSHFRNYLSEPDSWTADEISLLADRDSRVLVSAQAAFLPVPAQGQAEFNPVLFNYQSYAGDPAVLVIVATREGTSATIIDNVRDAFPAGFSWGQRLFFNQNGERASFTGERLSDFAGRTAPAASQASAEAGEESGLNMVLLIQVPLKQKNPWQDDEMVLAEEGFAAPQAAAESDVEAAVIGHGPVEGPFTEIDGLPIERDDRFPIRVTVQFYKATSNGVVSAADMADIAAQIRRVYDDADYVGSLVVDGPTERATEYDGPKEQPPGWWSGFWHHMDSKLGVSRQEVQALLQSMGVCARPCLEEPAPPAAAQPDEPFSLPFGREAVLEGEELHLRFEELLEESRCPSQVNCVAAGQARLMIAVWQPGQEPASFELSTNPAQEGEEATYAGYNIRLESLSPYPEQVDQEIPPEAYEAGLVISRGE